MGNNIKNARISAGMSQKEVAFSLHVSPPTVSEWESGKKSPTLENIVKLADLFNVTSDYLLCRNVDNKSSAGIDNLVPLTIVVEDATPSGTRSASEAALLSAYRSAPLEIQNIVDTALAPYKKAKDVIYATADTAI